MPGDRAFVGRTNHLRELRSLVDGVAAGAGGAVVLTGEAGAGKTRLAEEAAALAAADRVDVAWVTCWSSAAAPLSVWLDLAAAVAPEYAPPSIADETSETDPDLARGALVRRLVIDMRARLTAQATLLVVDDLQWCDPLSLRVLEQLVAALRTLPVGLVATAREEPGSAGEVTGVLRGGRTLSVPPLDSDELAELALELTGENVSPGRLRRLVERTGGNVLFARELLTASGDEVSMPAPRIESHAVAMFGGRLAELSPACMALLQAASVIGRRFRLDVLAESAGVDVAVMLSLLDEAQQHRLVRQAGIGSCEFVHPLIAEACASSAEFARRVRLHRDTAEALERLHDRGIAVAASEIAHHYANAAPAGVAAKAVEHAARAGRGSMAQLAYEDAARDFGRALAALDLCPDDLFRRAELLLHLADARAAIGDLPAARATYEQVADLARDHGWNELLARAALGVGSGPGGFEVPPFDRRQISLLEDAAEQAVGVLRAQVLARLSVALSLNGDASHRAALSDEAIDLAREADDPSVLGYALASRCDVDANALHANARRVAGSEIIDCARRASDSRLELLGRRLRVVALLELGEIDAVDEEINAYATTADRLGQVVYSWYVPLWRSMRAAMEGRLGASERLRGEAARLGSVAHSDNAAMLVPSQEAMLACELRAPEAAVRLFTELAERFPDYEVMTRPALAYAHAAGGDTDRACAVLDCVTLDDYRVDELGSEWLPTMVMLATAAGLMRSARLSTDVYGALLPYRDLHAIDGIGGFFVGSVERPLGMLAAVVGDGDAAAAHFDAALVHHRRMRAPLLVAGTLRDAGDALGDQGTKDDAEALFATLRRGAMLASSRGEPDRGDAGNTFRPDGDAWLVGWRGTSGRMRRTKGMADIARLLAQPNREIHVLDLVGEGATVAEPGTGDMIDDRARSSYRARLADIDEELADADSMGDAARSERLHVERDALLGELSSAYGLGGRGRRRGESAERARSTVTQRVRDAIARIEAVDPELGQHLRHAVKTGTYCSYAPEQPTRWQL